MRNEIKLSDEQIEAVFDEFPYGVDIDDVVFSGETIADYLKSRESYNEKGRLTEQEVAGFPSIMIQEAQLFAGNQRRDIVVIDFGAARGTIAL